MVLFLFALLPAAGLIGTYSAWRRLGRRKKRASWTLSAWLAGCAATTGVGLALLGGELYFRFAYDASDSFNVSLASQRWFERHYRLNSAGVRDDEDYRLARTPGVPRVTFLGDSFTAGHGVPDVADRFVDRIQAAKRGSWEVHMLAQNGLDTTGEIKHLAGAIRRGYQVDHVVLVYCLNDIAEIIPEWSALLARLEETSGSMNWILRSSLFLNHLYLHAYVSRDPDIQDYYGFVKKAYEGPAWERQKRHLELLNRLVRRSGGKLSVVVFPFLHIMGPRYEYAAVHRQLKDFWSGIGVPSLDLLEIYREHPPASLVANRFDAHPNARAHALAAEAILAFLESSKS